MKIHIEIQNVSVDMLRIRRGPSSFTVPTPRIPPASSVLFSSRVRLSFVMSLICAFEVYTESPSFLFFSYIDPDSERPFLYRCDYSTNDFESNFEDFPQNRSIFYRYDNKIFDMSFHYLLKKLYLKLFAHILYRLLLSGGSSAEG